MLLYAASDVVGTAVAPPPVDEGTGEGMVTDVVLVKVPVTVMPALKEVTLENTEELDGAKVTVSLRVMYTVDIGVA